MSSENLFPGRGGASPGDAGTTVIRSPYSAAEKGVDTAGTAPTTATAAESLRTAVTPSEAGQNATASFHPVSPPAPQGDAPSSSPPPAAPASSTEPTRRRRRWPLWTAAAALLVVGAAGAGGYAYADHYSDVAVPGTSVAGADVSGMTHDQIVQSIEDRAEAATVTLTGDATATPTLADLGVTVDAQATADAAMASSSSVVDRFKALTQDHEVAVVTTTDPSTVESYAASLVPADRAAARNASVKLGEDAVTFEIVPSVEGTSLSSSALSDAARTAAGNLTSTSVTVTYSTSDPAVSDADAQAVADKANGIVSQEVTVASADGESSFTAESTTKVSWVTLTAKEDAAPTVGVDAAKVSQWVTAQGESLKVEPVTGVRNVNSRGDVVATSVEAVDGRSVSNAEAVTTEITQALDGNKPYSGTFKVDEVKATWTQHTIADGAENLPYQAANGEKWIDINLSSKTVTGYEGATVVRGPVSIVDGAAATPTVTGTYHVYLQLDSQTMRGQNADGTDYVSEDVPWITYFHQGYALHGAPWRSSFGYSGSHGCLNMPVSEAKWFHDWSAIGTTVVSHY